MPSLRTNFWTAATVAVLAVVYFTEAQTAAAGSAGPNAQNADAQTFMRCLSARQASAATPPSKPPATTEEAGRRLSFSVLGPNDPDFAVLEDRMAQKRTKGITPMYIAKPNTTADVALLVRCAAAAKMPLAVRNGAHSYEGLSTVKGGLVIYLGGLQGVEFESTTPSSALVSVGAGMLAGPLYLAITPRGYALPGPIHADVGISGLALGGGLGPHTRALGVTSDAIRAATVVLADGRVVTASATSNPDLFFAIRGGGGNFGVVTNWVFEVTAAPKGRISYLKYEWRYTDQLKGKKFDEDILRAFMAWQPWKLPKTFAFVELFLGYGGMYIEIYYWGPSSDIKRLIKDNPKVFQAAPGGKVVADRECTWEEFMYEVATNPKRKANFGAKDLQEAAAIKANAADKGNFKATSIVFDNPMPAAAQKALLQAMDERRGDTSFYQIRVLGGAVAEVAASAAAFPHRAALLDVQVKSDAPDAVPWVQRVKAAVSRYGSGYEYLNYIDCDTYRPDKWEAFFRSNAARLKAIQAKYDPRDTFNAIDCSRLYN